MVTSAILPLIIEKDIIDHGSVVMDIEYEEINGNIVADYHLNFVAKWDFTNKEKYSQWMESTDISDDLLLLEYK